MTGGLPTVVRYDTTRFPRVTGKPPARPGGQLFAGGAGGTARLQQRPPIPRLPDPAAPAPGLSGYLGGRHNAGP